jgi:hypothetical protein
MYIYFYFLFVLFGRLLHWCCIVLYSTELGPISILYIAYTHTLPIYVVYWVTYIHFTFTVIVPSIFVFQHFYLLNGSYLFKLLIFFSVPIYNFKFGALSFLLHNYLVKFLLHLFLAFLLSRAPSFPCSLFRSWFNLFHLYNFAPHITIVLHVRFAVPHPHINRILLL